MHATNNPSNAVAPVGRGDERIRLRRPAVLSLGSDGSQPVDVQLEDISFSGAGMVSGVDVAVGATVALLLQTAGTSPCTIRGRILGCKRVSIEQFRISMQFDAVSGPTMKRLRYAFFPNDSLA